MSSIFLKYKEAPSVKKAVNSSKSQSIQTSMIVVGSQAEYNILGSKGSISENIIAAVHKNHFTRNAAAPGTA